MFKSQIVCIASALVCATAWAEPVHSTPTAHTACTKVDAPVSSSGRWALVFDFEDAERPMNGCLVVWLPDTPEPVQRLVPCQVHGKVSFTEGAATFDGGYISCTGFTIDEAGATEDYADFFVSASGMRGPGFTGVREMLPLYWHPSVQFGVGPSRGAPGTHVRLADHRSSGSMAKVPADVARGDVRFDFAEAEIAHRVNNWLLNTERAPRTFHYDNTPATIYVGHDPATGSVLRGVTIDTLIIDPNISGGL
jgi:hypothetical protein